MQVVKQIGKLGKNNEKNFEFSFNSRGILKDDGEDSLKHKKHK